MFKKNNKTTREIKLSTVTSLHRQLQIQQKLNVKLRLQKSTWDVEY